MKDSSRYFQWQEQQQQEWEAACRRCGACCGAVEGDPCECLAGGADGQYVCTVYENRFGLHRTIDGREFECVPVREIMHKNWLGDNGCVYKKTINSSAASKFVMVDEKERS